MRRPRLTAIVDFSQLLARGLWLLCPTKKVITAGLVSRNGRTHCDGGPQARMQRLLSSALSSESNGCARRSLGKEEG